MDARRLAEADACAFMVIDRWGDRLELSQEGSDCLTTMRAVVGSSQEAFLGCIRLRLIARLSKVLRLLDRLPGPGPVLVAAARAWVSLASKPPATDSTDLEAATGAVEELLQVRDAGQAEGAVSAAAAAAVDAESLITEVIHAAQHINSQCLPMPCKVLLSKVKEGLQQYASDTQGHDAEEPETIDVSSTATESQETPPEITAWQASQPSRPVTEQRPSAHHMHSPLLVREQGKILRRRRSSFGSDAARSRAPSFVGEEASEVESLHRGRASASSATAELTAESTFADPAAAASSASASSTGAAAAAALVSRPPPPVERDIFSMPLPGERALKIRQAGQMVQLPGEGDAEQPPKRVRAQAPTLEGDSEVLQGHVPAPHRSYQPWTLADEQRLMEGFKKYGRSWETIRTTFQLRHKTSGQVKDKWRNLRKLGQGGRGETWATGGFLLMLLLLFACGCS